MIVSKALPYRIVKPFSLRSILLFTLIIGLILHLRYSLLSVISEETSRAAQSITASHPVERLILQALRKHDQLIARQSRSPEEAIKNYKKRYNRNPPPGYSKWVRYALAHNSTIIDDYDVIADRIDPFRAISPFDLNRRLKSVAEDAGSFETLQIRDGKLDKADGQFSTHIQDIIDQLPDLDIPLNWFDEPRVVGQERDANKVKWEDLAHKNSWEILTSAQCQFSSQKAKRWGSAKPKSKFVENVKDMMDICQHPEYENQHGFFPSPSNFQATRNLVPFLSTTSLSTMHDILTPGLDYVDWHYLGDDKSKDHIPWSQKKDMMYWKGWSTGSCFKRDTWPRSHRMRFVQMFKNNKKWFNVGFSKYVQCEDYCEELEKQVGLVPMDPPTTGFDYKYAMDMDGNGYSGRYYRLLQSNNLVFKQTLFVQWHDDRLIPWAHYIPVSLGMEELEELLEYFTNDHKGQKYAAKIAELSKEWATRSLRAVDMTIYTYRVLLEYATLFESDAPGRY